MKKIIKLSRDHFFSALYEYLLRYEPELRKEEFQISGFHVNGLKYHIYLERNSNEKDSSQLSLNFKS
jgi:hypothetical protein